MTANTKIKNDLAMYDEHAESWWSDRDKTFRSLKALSPFKISLIKKHLGSPRSKSIVDLGCGGGLLSIPLAKEGAIVTGLDLSRNSLAAARAQNVPNTKFIDSDIRYTRLADSSADWALLADVVDHLPDYHLAIKEAYRLLKPGGKLYVGTINRSTTSKILAIFIGEGLGLIPKGTHDWDLFIKPEELVLVAKKIGFKLDLLCGEAPDFFKTILNWTIHLKEVRSLNLAYSAFFTK